MHYVRRAQLHGATVFQQLGCVVTHLLGEIARVTLPLRNMSRNEKFPPRVAGKVVSPTLRDQFAACNMYSEHASPCCRHLLHCTLQEKLPHVTAP